MNKPKKVIILGKEYSIKYVSNPAEVDMYKRESLWGQIDYWTRTIRIYDNETTDTDIVETIIHEVIHGLEEDLKLKCFKDKHDDLALLAMGLADTLIRNKWITSL